MKTKPLDSNKTPFRLVPIGGQFAYDWPLAGRSFYTKRTKHLVNRTGREGDGRGLKFDNRLTVIYPL